MTCRVPCLSISSAGRNATYNNITTARTHGNILCATYTRVRVRLPIRKTTEREADRGGGVGWFSSEIL